MIRKLLHGIQEKQRIKLEELRIESKNIDTSVKEWEKMKKEIISEVEQGKSDIAPHTKILYESCKKSICNEIKKTI